MIILYVFSFWYNNTCIDETNMLFVECLKTILVFPIMNVPICYQCYWIILLLLPNVDNKLLKWNCYMCYVSRVFFILYSYSDKMNADVRMHIDMHLCMKVTISSNSWENSNWIIFVFQDIQICFQLTLQGIQIQITHQFSFYIHINSKKNLNINITKEALLRTRKIS